MVNFGMRNAKSIGAATNQAHEFGQVYQARKADRGSDTAQLLQEQDVTLWLVWSVHHPGVRVRQGRLCLEFSANFMFIVYNSTYVNFLISIENSNEWEKAVTFIAI